MPGTFFLFQLPLSARTMTMNLRTPRYFCAVAASSEIIAAASRRDGLGCFCRFLQQRRLFQSFS